MSKSEKKINVAGLELSAKADLGGLVDTSNEPNDQQKANSLISAIENAVKDLFYPSETDAEIEPFVGSQTDFVNKENLLFQTKNNSNIKVEEKEFTEFFKQLTKVEDWFGEVEKENAAKFSFLRDLLKNNLNQIKFFKLGKINIDIYVVGLDAEGVLTGVQTKAVET
jgi:hypothetical protein